MKRTTLLRRTPMRRRARRRGREARKRDPEFLGWVKLQPCRAAKLGLCSDNFGFVEADHAGRRGMSVKADDDTAIPLCNKHHFERTNFTGAFKSWNQSMMRAWLLEMIARTRARYAGFLHARSLPDLW